jgi:hypothetical protein
LHGAATAQDQIPTMEAFHELAHQMETIWGPIQPPSSR